VRLEDEEAARSEDFLENLADVLDDQELASARDPG
jgi:hypothetical protein